MSMSQADGGQFDIGRVVSRTVGLVSRNLVPFSIMAAIFAGAPYFLLQMSIPALMQGDPGMLGIITILGVLVSVVGGMVLQGALTRASVDDLSGAGVNLGSAISVALATLLPMIGLGIVMALGLGLGFILLFIPGVYLALCWAVSAPVLVVERLGVIASMQRSTALTQGHRWPILGLFVLFAVIVLILNFVIALLIPGGATTMMGLPGEGPATLAILILTVVQIFTSVIGTAGAASVYFELRQVKDGIGATDLAKVFA